MDMWKPYIIGLFIGTFILFIFGGLLYITGDKSSFNSNTYELVSKSCTGTGLITVHNDRYLPESDYYVCMNKGAYCRKECKETFNDLNDTWGSNTANKTDLGSGINQCIETCMATN